MYSRRARANSHRAVLLRGKFPILDSRDPRRDSFVATGQSTPVRPGKSAFLPGKGGGEEGENKRGRRKKRLMFPARGRRTEGSFVRNGNEI